MLTKRRVVSIAFCVFCALICAVITIASPINPSSAYASGAAWNGTVAEGFSSGEGTEEAPYIVATADQLAFLASAVNSGDDFNGKFVKLADGVRITLGAEDRTGTGWTPIGYFVSESDYKPFAGTFDGNASTGAGIDNLLAVESAAECLTTGLFGYVAAFGKLRNLNLGGYAVLKTAPVEGAAAGAAAGYNEGKLDKVTISCEVVAESGGLGGDSGGLVGVNASPGILNGCTVKAFRSAGFYSSGGIAGVNSEQSNIVGCSVGKADISAARNSGGIAGENSGSIKKITVAAGSDFNLEGQNIGGIAGESSRGVISLCAFNGELTARSSCSAFGGVAGRNDGELENCAVKGGLNAANAEYFGGVAGISSGGVTGCYYINSSFTSAAEYAGGITSRNGGRVENCFFKGSIAAEYAAAGIAAVNDGYIADTLAVGITSDEGSAVTYGITGGAVSGYAGGIVAINSSLSLERNLAFANMTAAFCGGITGDGSEAGASYYDGSAFFGENAAGEAVFDWSAFTPPTGWTRADDSLPRLDYFISYSGAAYAGVTDAFASDMEAVCALADVVTVALDDTERKLCNGLAFQFPSAAKAGFDFLHWKSGTESHEVSELVIFKESSSFESVWSIKDVILEAQSDDILKTYNDRDALLTAQFAHELSLIYRWYYCASEDGVFSVINDAAESELAVRGAAESGYYYCEATASYGGESAIARTENFKVDIFKAVYETASHGPIAGGKYDGSALSAFSPGRHFYWVSPDTVPSVPGGDFSAYYNADPDNYENYYLTITLTLEKGDYDGINHEDVDGGAYQGRTLDFYPLEDGFRWADGTIRPTVAGSASGYSVLYNADSVNYNDFSLTVKLLLVKGDYRNITHKPIIGVYSPSVTLNDYPLGEHFTWSDGSVTPTCDLEYYDAEYCADPDNYNPYALQITVVVEQAPPTVNPIVAPGTLYEGDAPPAVSLASGDTPGEIFWRDDAGLSAGETVCTWVFIPADEVNYKGAMGETAFSVNELVATRLAAASPPQKTEYEAFETFVAKGMIIKVIYNSGKETETRSYTVTYPYGERFVVGHEYIAIGYTEGEAELELRIGVSVSKIVLAEPADGGGHVYDGTLLTSSVKTNDLFTVSGNTAVSAGNYTGTARLADPDNYRWSETEGAECSFAWAVKKNPVSKPHIAGEYRYNGAEQVCEVVSNAFYEVIGNRAVYANDYNLTVRLKDAANNCWSDETTDDLLLVWTIGRKLVAEPQAIAREYVYNGQNQTFEYVYADGLLAVGVRQTDAGSYTVSFGLADGNYVWAAGGSGTKSLTWIISPYAVRPPEAESTEFIYDGREKNLLFPQSAAYTVAGGTETDAGEYRATVSLVSDNYCWTEGDGDIFVEWRIAKRAVVKPEAEGDPPIYTGKELAAPIPSSEYYVLTGDRETAAGDYVATVSLADGKNTEWSDGTSDSFGIAWKIEKRTLDLPTHGIAYRYTGETVTASINVDSRCPIIGGTGIAAAEYVASVALPDEDNYVWADGTAEAKVVPWSILPARVPRPAVNGVSVYSPAGQTAAINESPLYTLSGNTGLNVGAYVATAVLKDKSNYRWDNDSAEDLTINWRIVKAAVVLPTKDRDLIYSGLEQRVSISASAAYEVTGDTGTSAGEYTARIALKDTDNYEWEDGTSEVKTIIWRILTLTLDAGEGSGVFDGYVAGTPLPAPTRENYLFEGWYASPDFSGERITSLTELGADTVLYAKWTAEPTSEPAVAGGDKTDGLSLRAKIGLIVLGVCAAIAIAIVIFVLSTKKTRRYRD